MRFKCKACGGYVADDDCYGYIRGLGDVCENCRDDFGECGLCGEQCADFLTGWVFMVVGQVAGTRQGVYCAVAWPYYHGSVIGAAYFNNYAIRRCGALPKIRPAGASHLGADEPLYLPNDYPCYDICPDCAITFGFRAGLVRALAARAKWHWREAYRVARYAEIPWAEVKESKP